MNRYFRRLAALVSTSLTPSANAMVVPKDPEPDDKEAPHAVSLLNERVSAELLQHRSHSSHGSHGSHRSSSGGGYRRPAPAPSPAPRPPQRREPLVTPTEDVGRSDPLGQEPRPAESIPDRKKPRSVSDLDPEALKNVVMRMQLALQFEGYYQGNIDGVMGPGTREAVKRFKKAKSIPGDTVFDARTLNALGVAGF